VTISLLIEIQVWLEKLGKSARKAAFTLQN